MSSVLALVGLLAGAAAAAPCLDSDEQSWRCTVAVVFEDAGVRGRYQLQVERALRRLRDPTGAGLFEADGAILSTHPILDSQSTKREMLARQLDDVLFVGADQLPRADQDRLDRVIDRLRGPVDYQSADRGVVALSDYDFVLRLHADDRDDLLMLQVQLQGSTSKAHLQLPLVPTDDQVVAALLRLLPELDQPPAVRLSLVQQGAYATADHPVAENGATMPAVAGTPLLLDAGKSTDPELGAEVLRFRWTIDGQLQVGEQGPGLARTFDEPADPTQVHVLLEVSDGGPWVQRSVVLQLDPLVRLTDRTPSLWVAGHTVQGTVRKWWLYVEPDRWRGDTEYWWRQVEGPALACPNVATQGYDSCTDEPGLQVRTERASLTIQTVRPGPFSFEVVELSRGIPSAVGEAHTHAVYTRSSMRPGTELRVNLGSGWSGSGVQVQAGPELGVPPLPWLRGRLALVGSLERERLRFGALGVQAGLALGVLDTLSSTLDNPGRDYAPRYRTTIAGSVMGDLFIYAGYQHPGLVDLSDTDVAPDPGLQLWLGPELRFNQFTLRVLSQGEVPVGAGSSAADRAFGVGVELGMSATSAPLARGRVDQDEAAAFYRLKEQREEGRLCSDYRLVARQAPPDGVRALRCLNLSQLLHVDAGDRRALGSSGDIELRMMGQSSADSARADGREGTRLRVLALGDAVREGLDTGAEDAAITDVVTRVAVSVHDALVTRCQGASPAETAAGPPAMRRLDDAELSQLRSDLSTGNRLAGGSAGAGLRAAQGWEVQLLDADACPAWPTEPVTMHILGAARGTELVLGLDGALPDGDALLVRRVRFDLDGRRLFETLDGPLVEVLNAVRSGD